MITLWLSNVSVAEAISLGTLIRSSSNYPFSVTLASGSEKAGGGLNWIWNGATSASVTFSTVRCLFSSANLTACCLTRSLSSCLVFSSAWFVLSLSTFCLRFAKKLSICALRSLCSYSISRSSFEIVMFFIKERQTFWRTRDSLLSRSFCSICSKCYSRCSYSCSSFSCFCCLMVSSQFL